MQNWARTYKVYSDQICWAELHQQPCRTIFPPTDPEVLLDCQFWGEHTLGVVVVVVLLVVLELRVILVVVVLLKLWVDIAYWWSGNGKGLRLQPAQQACFEQFSTN